jgi:hypothetical protein
MLAVDPRRRRRHDVSHWLYAIFRRRQIFAATVVNLAQAENPPAPAENAAASGFTARIPRRNEKAPPAEPAAPEDLSLIEPLS